MRSLTPNCWNTFTTSMAFLPAKKTVTKSARESRIGAM